MLSEYDVDGGDNSDPLTSQLEDNSEKEEPSNVTNGKTEEPKEKDLVEQSLDDDDNKMSESINYRDVSSLPLSIHRKFSSPIPVFIYESFQNRTEDVPVDVNLDGTLSVDISDALSERDKVIYPGHERPFYPLVTGQVHCSHKNQFARIFEA